MTAFALGTAADTLGFVVDARDSRRRVVACAGAPACASGLIPARALAAEIAAQLPQGGMAVHVSGCAKGCAYPAPAPLTIVGTAQGCGLVRDGTARGEPGSYFTEEHAVAEAARLTSKVAADA
jgi:precorrin-3B synthase